MMRWFSMFISHEEGKMIASLVGDIGTT